ncbi:MAG TPA: hypothetical protein VFM43_03725 [Gaiellaceae bacterium]|nr:hypothetical protein [Gaiellaceae bacterium]
MRALLATAGLLALAGSAAAGSPTAHTLRKSPGGPIEAIAQDGRTVAWLSSSTKGACAEVHVLSPGVPDQTLPQPAAGSMTCRWDLTDGQAQLAVAARISTVLWTLHESAPAPFDNVVAASFGGPERQIKKLAHASDGTGKWLVGVAGSGRTLAYSWDDVEYVDKLACLSGGSCRRKIADGGIGIVTPTGDQPLPGAKPALQLAASAGRIAYIPATRVMANHPGASTNNSVYVVDAVTGDPVSSAYVRGVPAAIALSPHVLAVLTQRGPRDRISWFSATDGTKLGSVLVSSRAEPQLAATDQVIVYRVNQTLLAVSTATGAIRTLAKTAPDPVGLTLKKNQLVWAENRTDTGRLRALAVPGS